MTLSFRWPSWFTLDSSNLLEGLRRGFWWLLIGVLGMYTPVHAPNLLHPERWVQSGLRDWLLLLGWAVFCRILGVRWSAVAVIVCLVGLLPITSLTVNNATEVNQVANPDAMARMLLMTPIAFALGLFARFPGAVIGTVFAAVFLGRGGNEMQLFAGANVLMVIGLYGSLTRWAIDRLSVVHAKLAQSAVTDVLTGLGNRRALETDAKTSKDAWLTVWDVDDLKRVNDTYGHAAGDSYLLAFTVALNANLDIQDRGYRIGGDEFCTLTQTVPINLIALVRERFPSVSVGFSKLEADLDVALLEADGNLYNDKRQRKGTLEPAQQTAQT